jgi:hypothetical protein
MHKKKLKLKVISSEREVYEMRFVEQLFYYLDNNDMEGADKTIDELRPHGSLILVDSRDGK